MSAKIIVSYDGTANDDDALALGSILVRAGASIALAYVRHSREFDPRREALAQHDAEHRLAQGASWLGDPGIDRHVVLSPSTGEGLGRLAEQEGASMIVFGSDYRTTPGHAEPGTSAQQLLQGGRVAIAVAAAGLRTEGEEPIRSVAAFAPDGDGSATDTAAVLAERLHAALVAPDTPGVDLLVIGSQSSAPEGRLALSGSSRALLNSARGSVLVLPSGHYMFP